MVAPTGTIITAVTIAVNSAKYALGDDDINVALKEICILGGLVSNQATPILDVGYLNESKSHQYKTGRKIG